MACRSAMTRQTVPDHLCGCNSPRSSFRPDALLTFDPSDIYFTEASGRSGGSFFSRTFLLVFSWPHDAGFPISNQFGIIFPLARSGGVSLVLACRRAEAKESDNKRVSRGRVGSKACSKDIPGMSVQNEHYLTIVFVVAC
jgi:hypothetical protein